MINLRVIGDVHAQIDFAVRDGRPTYLDLIAGCPYSVQVGDMGDAEAYDTLVARVDPNRHRFFPGNHDHYDRLPDHSLGDYGKVTLSGVTFFFMRGAASRDKSKLLQMGERIGRRLWFPEEELTDDQMAAARSEFTRIRPAIMMSHDAPTRIARFAHRVSARRGAEFVPSRTSAFLTSLLEIHRPQLWIFGHYHLDWDYLEDGTRFHCVGELSFLDVASDGTTTPPASFR